MSETATFKDSCPDCGLEPCELEAYAAKYGAADSVVHDLYWQWEGEYRLLLGKSKRWEGFCYLMRDLLARERPVIVETGTLREPGNWMGDGQSTRLWKWVVEHKPGGMAVSVDVDLGACRQAVRECPGVHVGCADAVTFLRGFFPYAMDLLYLDSAEDPVNELCELTAAWERLPSGCLIASDDAPTKAVLTRKFFEALGITPVLDSYIVIWRKP